MNASIWEGAYRLAADLTAELEEVKQIVGTLRNITATGGMPKARDAGGGALLV